ncbi:MAG: hypothetical protein R2749_13190 [Acidimicrobiales bacterium]
MRSLPTVRPAAVADRLAPWAWSAALVAVIIGPMAGRGWVLTLDWVVGPRSAFWPQVLDRGALPAGPLFFAGAALLHLVAGAAVGWAVPATALLVAGRSAWHCGATTTWGRAAATTVAVWNPFVQERLYAGQPAMLAGYAATLGMAAALAHRDPAGAAPQPAGAAPQWRAFGKAGLWWAAGAACSVQFAVLGAIVLVAVAPPAGARARRAVAGHVALATAIAATVTAGWLLAAGGEPPASGGSEAAVAFATRPDPRWGLLGGTLLQRGFWRVSPGAPGVVPHWWVDIAALAVLALAVAGGVVRWRRHRAAAVRLLVALGAAWVLSWGPLGPLGAGYRWVVATVPGGGAFREAGKFLAIVAALTAVLVGPAVDRLRATVPAGLRGSRGAAGAGGLHRVTGVAAAGAAVAAGLAAVLLPVGAAPGLAWGVGGRLAAVRYPAAWHDADRVIATARPGSVLVLPGSGYTDPGFTGGRVVANPATAFFGPAVRPGTDPDVPGVAPPAAVAGIEGALASPDPRRGLTDLGVDWVLELDADRTGARSGLIGSAPGATPPIVVRDAVVLWPLN